VNEDKILGGKTMVIFRGPERKRENNINVRAKLFYTFCEFCSELVSEKLS
jgi:hypothetical protein